MNFINIIIINNNNNNNKVRSAPRRGRTPEGVRDPPRILTGGRTEPLFYLKKEIIIYKN